MKKTWMSVSAMSLLLSLSLVLPPAAQAAFATAEQEELKRLLGAQSDVYTALFYEAYAIRNGGWNKASHPHLIGALRSTSAAMREINYAVSILLNVVPEQVQTPLYDAFAALPRSERVSKAFGRVDRALGAVSVADGWLASAAGVKLTDTAYQDAVARAKGIWLGNARAKLEQVDRGLAYLEPNPSSYPKIIGPHGLYDDAQWKLWRAGFYMNDLLDYFIGTIENGPPSKSWNFEIFKIVDSAGQIMLAEVESQLRLAIPVTAEDAAGFDTFFRVLSLMKKLTIETAEHYHAVQFNTGTLVAAATPTGWKVELGPVLKRLSDSWRHMDAGIWEMLDFPNCTPAQGARGCLGL